MAIQTVNPFNNEVIKTFKEMTPQEIEKAVTKAHEAFKSWKKTPFSTRSKVLHEAAAKMRSQKEELAQIITLEMGKLISDARAEVDLSANILDYYADNAEKFLKRQKVDVETGEAYVVFDPIGVVFGIEPWNFPFYQVARIAAPNIMAGNTVLIKHASNVPQCGIALERLFKEGGAPEGVYTNLLISSKAVAQVIENPKIAGVSLTGSEGAGAHVAETAGKSLKKSVLELGGNDPFIVLDDANIEKTLDSAIWAKMNNTGQCCIAAKRYILMDSIADEFIKKFSEKLAKLKPGDPSKDKTTLGPLSSEGAAVLLQKQIDETIKKGAKALVGGKRPDIKGAFVTPTVLVDVKPGMPAYSEELFGPVATIFRVKTEEEAIHLANDTVFGLGASVFSDNLERAEKVAKQIDSGMVFINHPTWTEPDLPFGGTKKSGYGRELSEVGIFEFVNKKLIRISDYNDPF
ncbi:MULTISPECIES: NAD-dependent succinate-semialdehyde dehydrogenase [Parachlamydia]|jgi:succinate-semialdehyde dehydrogenase/glutarate-semialdehyde dehydrogenase|uniref:Succinate-semialdehyde dehydrogenase [NADP+] n=2 Tax=Parachlamydia acanthamoebae TaxID=83552 RepID=F8KZ65_PARAV|nr:NAD-dependent succinate-semialdehyde dehydrogenase [Parachlamydia acanthamoebae]EFB41932.1 aldehyde dehydrogenase [Parachlamydia acanthamoebae str. Hall's coccus]CCB86188.1 succinate-semialdehyde dehydrogenase [NADP+] [Parachlamydia acanthamoebae UV-7]